MKQTVSVVIPTFGRSKSLQASIDSVREQTYTPVEIIVVDDNGVGTESQQHVEALVSQYGDNVRYIAHEKNMGGSSARNTGGMASKGEYICFLDDDDLFHPEKIEKQVELLETNPHFVACFCDHIRQNVITNQVTAYHSPYSGNILLPVLLYQIDVCSGSTLMVRRGAFKELGGFTAKLKRRQDYEFLARLSAMGEIGLVPEPLVTIVTHDGSYQQRIFKDIEKTQQEYLKVVEPLFARLTPEEVSDVLFANNSTLLVEAVKKKTISGICRYMWKCGLNMKTFKLIISKIKKLA